MTKRLLSHFCTLLNKSKVTPSIFKKTLFTAFVLLGTITSGHAQLPAAVKNDYSFSESVGNAYADITGGTTIFGPSGATTLLNVANFTTSYPIGFNFIYNNTQFSEVFISDNGYFYFKGPTPVTAPSVAAGAALSSTVAYLGAISGYGSSLTAFAGEAGEVSYVKTGALGNQVFTVQYKNLRRYDGVSVHYDGLMNFQIKLYEADNRIEVLYKDFTTTQLTQVKGQVGLRGPTNVFANGNVNNRNNSASTTFVPTVDGTLNGDGLITRFINPTVYGPAPGTKFVWTPCFNPTGLVTALQGDNITVNFSWTAPLYQPVGNNYEWEVRTSGLPGSGATGLYASATTALTSASVTSLTIGQAYVFYVRSSCKGGPPTWTQYLTGSVTPSCSAALNVPYYQDFETAVVPAIPLCTATLAVTDQPMVTKNNTTGQPNAPLYGFTSKNLITGGPTAYPGGSTNATDNWFFTQGINLAAAGTYKLTYTYGGTREQVWFSQRLKVAYGTAKTVLGMSNVVANHPNIKNSPLTFSVNFTVVSAGVYYLGFNAYAGSNNGFLQIDNISLVPTTCFPPTLLTASQIGPNSANIGWTAPAANPSGGYQYYYSTSSTTPLASDSPSGTVPAGTLVTTIASLNPSTTYYYWVRSSCGGSDFSQWSAVGSFTTTTPPCTPVPSSVDGTGITNVTFGTINNTTSNETGNYGNFSNLFNYVSQTQPANITLTYSTAGFAYWTRIWVDWNNDGDFYDTSEEVYFSGTELPAGVNNISFSVPTLIGGVLNTAGPHRMRIGGADINNLSGVAAGQGPCYIGPWGTFEDYTIYVVPPPPALSIEDANGNLSSTFCSGDTSPVVDVTVGAGSFDTFSWSPAGFVTGDVSSGWIFNPTVTTVYKLTATKLVAGVLYANTASYTVNVNAVPTPITITAVPATYCQGNATIVKLTATGGIITGTPIITENFNGGTNTFSVVNSSTNGTVSYGNWTLHNSPYSIPTVNTDDPLTISSNDGTQFYMSDSDAQGAAGQTNEELISPAFPLTTFTDANLSFWHYYKAWSNGSAKVEISTDGGGAWTTLPGGTWTTVSTGTATGFVNVVINLGAYATPGNTNSNVKIRFKYVSNYGYRWCIDNVQVTGSSSSNTKWTSTGVGDMFTDAAGAIPYANQPLQIIYVRPTANRTYTATATTASPASCPATKNIAVGFTALAGGTATGNQTVSCGSPASDISVAGYLPSLAANILGWESALNPTFTGPGYVALIPGSVGLSTLTSALIGTVSTTTYYRAIISGCNTVRSTTVTITVATNTYSAGAWSFGTDPTIGDAAIINGPFIITSDLSMCSLQVASGAVVVNSGVTLRVENALNVTGGSLTFNDGASLVQGAATTTNSNSGNIIYKRNSRPARKFDYTYWSSPVGLQTMSGIFTAGQQPLSDKYFWFNATTYNWTQIATPSITPMDIGKGYIIRAPQSFDPIATQTIYATFTGVANNGNYNVNIVRTGANYLNCIGNPYPSAVHADDFVTLNATTFTNTDSPFAVGTTFYFWTHTTALPTSPPYNYLFSDYATYNFTGGTAATYTPNGIVPTGYIAAGQSFMVRGVKEGSYVATFTNAMRSGGADNMQFFRTSGSSRSNSTMSLEKHRLWLDLTNTAGAFKQTLIGYIQNATNNYENGFDGDLLEVDNPVSLYSVIGNNKLAIQGRALPFSDADQVPLGFKSSTAGSYTISLSNTDGLFSEESTSIYLEDKLLNTIHDLRQNAYTFVSESGVFETRFVLRYNDTALAVNPYVINDNAAIAYAKNGDIHVETSNIIMKSVQIFDIRGRLLMEQNELNSAAALFASPGIANQVLMIKINSADGKTIHKKIIF